MEGKPIDVVVGFIPLGEDPCHKCYLTNVCVKEGPCQCDKYWYDHPKSKRNGKNEVYIKSFVFEQTGQ